MLLAFGLVDRCRCVVGSFLRNCCWVLRVAALVWHGLCMFVIGVGLVFACVIANIDRVSMLCVWCCLVGEWI